MGKSVLLVDTNALSIATNRHGLQPNPALLSYIRQQALDADGNLSLAFIRHESTALRNITLSYPYGRTLTMSVTQWFCDSMRTDPKKFISIMPNYFVYGPTANPEETELDINSERAIELMLGTESSNVTLISASKAPMQTASTDIKYISVTEPNEIDIDNGIKSQIDRLCEKKAEPLIIVIDAAAVIDLQAYQLHQRIEVSHTVLYLLQSLAKQKIKAQLHLYSESETAIEQHLPNAASLAKTLLSFHTSINPLSVNNNISLNALLSKCSYFDMRLNKTRIVAIGTNKCRMLGDRSTSNLPNLLMKYNRDTLNGAPSRISRIDILESDWGSLIEDRAREAITPTPSASDISHDSTDDRRTPTLLNSSAHSLESNHSPRLFVIPPPPDHKWRTMNSMNHQ